MLGKTKPVEDKGYKLNEEILAEPKLPRKTFSERVKERKLSMEIKQKSTKKGKQVESRMAHNRLVHDVKVEAHKVEEEFRANEKAIEKDIWYLIRTQVIPFIAIFGIPVILWQYDESLFSQLGTAGAQQILDNPKEMFIFEYMFVAMLVWYIYSHALSLMKFTKNSLSWIYRRIKIQSFDEVTKKYNEEHADELLL